VEDDLRFVDVDGGRTVGTDQEDLALVGVKKAAALGSADLRFGHGTSIIAFAGG
jgi:hypothetical protein